VQLRYATGHTSEDYVSQQAWREASLPRCPLHPRGGCGFARHGTYARLTPPGTRVARWYCPQGHQTFSLLPDCLAARLPGTLAEVEAVVLACERAPSREAAADRLRRDIELPGALRWVRRRLQRVHAALTVLCTLRPDLFAGCPATIAGFRALLGVVPVLPSLRAPATAHIAAIPAPLGFRPRLLAAGAPRHARQQQAGPDPPPTSH
jgi:hypothetical protein